MVDERGADPHPGPGVRASVRRRLDVRDAGARDAGLPALAHQSGRGARRGSHPDGAERPARPGRGRRRRHWPRCPADGRRQLGGAGAWTGGVRRAGRPRTLDVGRHWPTYVVPRSHDIVVGGSDEEGDWSRTPDPETAERILERTRGLVPELTGAKVLRHKVGLRPVRPAVRLEEERRGATRVVHCYGHGGAGVTLSWGCADEVAAMVGGG